MRQAYPSDGQRIVLVRTHAHVDVRSIARAQTHSDEYELNDLLVQKPDNVDEQHSVQVQTDCQYDKPCRISWRKT